MIDIHTHILPGLDDGSGKLESSLDLAEEALEQGIHKVFATPHNLNRYSNSREQIVARVQALQEAMTRCGLNLQVLPGSEVYLVPDLVTRYKSGELMTLNDKGKHLLVEYPLQSIPTFADDVLFSLRMCGVTPILAHPERNTVLAERPELLEKLLRCGVLLQITAGSLTGKFGPGPARVCRNMLKRGQVHFIASDAHRPRGRGKEFREAVSIATELVGREQALRLVQGNLEYVIRGEEVPQGNLAEAVDQGSESETPGVWRKFSHFIKKHRE